MVDGPLVERDGLEWTLTLREGLRFHDGSPVLARDVVASIQRWWKRVTLSCQPRPPYAESFATEFKAERMTFKRAVLEAL